ncbi:PQQ-binding-like beta-propeller repeat protein [Streptomyces sp. NPDC002580]|uniref:outer membrane protein assembly factor BamB family protein n=1 Tax=Streptomyces sp. NPDC002580 TaxID=3364653 RepID=UPI00369CC9EB
MKTEQVEEKVRATLRAVALDGVRAPADLAEKVVRRHGRRRFSQAAGVTVAVAAISAGAVFGFGGGGAGDHDRPARPAVSPQGWKPWQSDVPGGSDYGCVVDGSALYCGGSKYDAAKFDANTGERLWTVKVNREGDGLRGPIAVRDGVVFAYRNHTAKNLPSGDYMGGTDLMAVDAGTGAVLWKVRMPQDDRTPQAAMLIKGAVLANTPSLRTMSALDPRTGKVMWSHTWAKGTICQRAVLEGVPHLACMRDAEKPDHTDVLRLDPATGHAEKVTTLPGGQQLIGTSGNRMVLAAAREPGSKDLKLTVIDGSGEQTSRSCRSERKPAKLDVVGDHLISVSWKGEASACSLTTGKRLWTAPAGFELSEKDMAVGNMAPAVVSATRGVVYLFGPGGDLSGLDLRTGEQVWHRHIETGEPSSGNIFEGSPQVLLYEDVLVARSGSKIVTLLPGNDD